MKLLLDTHALIWFLNGDAQLGAHARSLIEDTGNDVFVSVASLWEIAIKNGLGKLALGKPFGVLFPAELDANSIEIVGITIDHLKSVCSLPLHHRDPFDRLLVAQALVEGRSIISADAVLDSYGVTREW